MWISSHSCQGRRRTPRSSRANLITSKPRDVAGVSSTSGFVHTRGSVMPYSGVNEPTPSRAAYSARRCRNRSRSVISGATSTSGSSSGGD